MTWKKYLQNTKNKPSCALLKETLAYVTTKENALDLGAGALNDTREIVRGGFHTIDVVDMEPNVAELIKSLRTELHTGHEINFYNQSFESFVFPNSKYDLINAQYSLPFITPHKFDSVWSKIPTSLKPGGIFTGTFFGVEDEWNDGARSNITFHNKEEALSLFTQTNMNLIKFEEINKNGTTAAGARKHWHVFAIIASRSQKL